MGDFQQMISLQDFSMLSKEDLDPSFTAILEGRISPSKQMKRLFGLRAQILQPCARFLACKQGVTNHDVVNRQGPCGTNQASHSNIQCKKAAW